MGSRFSKQDYSDEQKRMKEYGATGKAVVGTDCNYFGLKGCVSETVANMCCGQASKDSAAAAPNYAVSGTLKVCQVKTSTTYIDPNDSNKKYTFSCLTAGATSIGASLALGSTLMMY